MSKDSYWFRHDSTAGRGLKLRKIQHIYSHWGKGVYWDIIELLRDQDGYRYEKDESSLQLLSDLIGCKDEKKFITWYRDCIHIGLFKEDDNYFYSSVLSANMERWEQSKENGQKGGNPRFKKGEKNPYYKAKDNLKDNPPDKGDDKGRDKHKSIEEYSIEHNKTKEMFAIFLKAYTGGNKRGLDVEFEYFKKTEKDWQGVCELLLPALKNQIAARKKKNDAGEFVPEWKHLKTWIYQKCWTEEIAVQQSTADHRTVPKPWAYEGWESYARDCIKRGLKPIPKDLADSIIVSQKGLNEFLDEHKEYAGWMY